ncbi:MAG: winged helix-turn-helix domain-containing protein [Pyrinomonadaceae bacterium]
MFWQPNLLYEFGPFRVDARERRLLRDDEVVPLTPKVFDILLVLIQNSGHILSKDEVMKLVWPNTAVEEGNIARNISMLRNALGERPREPQYIETVPWRGYRFVASVKEVRDRSDRPAITSIAVLPFVNIASDQTLEYLADGFAETLINNLSQLAGLKVMSRNSSFRYKDRATDARAIGRELNVQAVLMGRIAKRDDLLSISVELVDARDDSHLWGAQFNRQPVDIFVLQERIAQEITERLRLKVTRQEQQRLTRRHTENAEAYQLYLKGRYYFNKLTMDGVEKGIGYFQQAIDKDAHYALAYAGLGDSFNYVAKPVEAKQAVIKALDLDETLGEAHASLGFFQFIYDWDFAGAEREFKQALNLNPNYAEAHHWTAIYFANVGRHDEARVEAKRAVELDPLSLLMNMTPALTSYLARDYDGAAAELRKVLDMEPNFLVAHSVLGNVYVQQGLYERAMAEYQKVLELAKGVAVVETAMKAVVAHGYAKWGKRSKAMKMLDELEKASAVSLTKASSASLLKPSRVSSTKTSNVSSTKAGTVSAHSIAEVHAALGQSDQAFEWLNKACDQRDMQMVSMKTNPTLDPLRTDPRFAVLVRRVGLPQ